MDWYVDGAEHVGDLRRELARYLTRHAVRDSEEQVLDAELVVSEAVGNAIRHTSGPVWVSLAWTSELPVLKIYDIGSGFDPTMLRGGRAAHHSGPNDPATDPEAAGSGWDLESGRGLLIMQSLAPEVVAAVREHAGMVLSIRLGVPRRPSPSIDPPLRHTAALPSLAEARDEGGFGKESFLRALVVQLSQAVEDHHGPDAAEAAVAQVGTDVGGQMETEFRLAHEITGRLTPEELGRCYVRLKHAIDGGFTVVEATEERVVLENTRCPFGDTVLRAPALCRMTSSVFGGIAARNSPDGASVLLEERIAVGDPGCRVVVFLRPPPPEAEPFAHRYRAPTDTG